MPGMREKILNLLIVLIAAGAVLGNIAYSVDNLRYPDEDKTQTLVNRLEVVKEDLPPGGKVGYVPDFSTSVITFRELFEDRYPVIQAQLALVPVTLTFEKYSELVVFDIQPESDPAALQERLKKLKGSPYKDCGFELIKDYGDGLYLFRARREQ